jgi:hypothetical protein
MWLTLVHIQVELCVRKINQEKEPCFLAAHGPQSATVIHMLSIYNNNEIVLSKTTRIIITSENGSE